MPEDSTDTRGIHVQQLIVHASELLGFLAVHCGSPLMRQNSKYEIDAGDLVRRLDAELRSLEHVELPFQTRLGIQTVHKIFYSLIDRWQWHRVLSSGGDAFILAQRELWESRRRLFLSGVRSFMEAFAANQVSEPPKLGYWDDVKAAERERIPASKPLVTSTEEVEARRTAWIFSPYLSRVFPTREGEEYVELQTAIQHIHDGIRGTDLEASQSYRASRTADPPEDATLPSSNSDPLHLTPAKPAEPTRNGQSVPEPSRLTLDPSTWTVTFDGKEFVFSNSRAFKIFQVIAEANGSIVLSAAIREKIPGCNERTRIDKILADHVPEAIRRLIVGQSGRSSGYSIKLPKKRVRNGAR